MFTRLFLRLYNYVRYKLIEIESNCQNISGNVMNVQPILLIGNGKIWFGENVQIGFKPSPGLFSTYAHLEARMENAVLKFGNNIFINNNVSIIAEKSTIEIHDNVLIGTNVQIYDSDFHEINPSKRNSGLHKCKNVVIGKNVFIGNNVIILKGVSIGENSIISAGAVVYESFPSNVIIGGNPAKILKQIINE